MIPKPLRELVRQRAEGRCEYCQTSEWLNGLPGEVDHIFPRALGGPTDADNLCFACSSCNGYKTRQIAHRAGKGAEDHGSTYWLYTGQNPRSFSDRDPECATGRQSG